MMASVLSVNWGESEPVINKCSLHLLHEFSALRDGRDRAGGLRRGQQA